MLIPKVEKPGNNKEIGNENAPGDRTPCWGGAIKIFGGSNIEADRCKKYTSI
jgi:hypothetical protein